MNLAEIEQHKIIIKRCKELLKVSLKEDVAYLDSIIKKSNDILNDFNKKELTVVNFTQKEKGIWISSLKKSVKAKYLKPYLNKIYLDYDYDAEDVFCKEHYRWHTLKDGTKMFGYDYNELCDNCKKELNKREDDYRSKYENACNDFDEACNNTVFSDELKTKYTLLNRRSINQPNVIEKEIRDSLLTERLLEFQKQNKELITKYLL